MDVQEGGSVSRKLKFGVDEGAFSKDQHGGDVAKESETLCVLLKMLVAGYFVQQLLQVFVEHVI